MMLVWRHVWGMSMGYGVWGLGFGVTGSLGATIFHLLHKARLTFLRGLHGRTELVIPMSHHNLTNDPQKTQSEGANSQETEDVVVLGFIFGGYFKVP